MTLNQLMYVIAISKENSLNEAAKKLFVSQPSLTSSLQSLEKEVGFEIFTRSNNGISITTKGAEFLGYAKSVVEQYDLLEAKFITQTNVKRTFSVSMQHYTFAVNAFVKMVNDFGMDNYEFEIRETRTYEVIEDVRNQRSEIGVLYINDFNRVILSKTLGENNLEFTPLFDCSIYAYMSRNNPLAIEKLKNGELIKMEELDDYPCLAFDQGDHNSAYFAEEMLSSYQYKKLIRVNDRATILNFMIGSNGYTLCSGIICEDLNGSDYCAIKLDTDEKMTIGYISRKKSVMSKIAVKYIEELATYKEKLLK